MKVVGNVIETVTRKQGRNYCWR